MSAPLVFLQGWGSRASGFDALQARLAGADTPREYRHPQSRSTPADMAHWADMLVPELPARPAVVLGWSQGAQLAMCLAARHPARVRALVLLAATPRFVAAADWPHGLDEPTVAGFRQGYLHDAARTRRRFIALQSLGDAQRHEVAAALAMHAEDDTRHHAALANGLRLLAETDLRGQLPAASLPALLIHGAQDALMPVAAMQWLAQRWHASRTLLLPHCAHAPHLSQPHAVAAAIGEFLDRLDHAEPIGHRG